MRQADAEVTGETLWMWGEIQKSLGRLEEQGLAMRLRQDDMRRELLGRISRLEKGSRNGNLGWLKHIPWDRVAVLAMSVLGAMGWMVPRWLKMLAGL